LELFVLCLGRSELGTKLLQDIQSALGIQDTRRASENTDLDLSPLEELGILTLAHGQTLQ
jgi:hypothetical protein